MGKYRMQMSKEDVMGEGTSSICRKATVIQTGLVVAIKVYKTHKEGAKHEDVKLQKFKRQIEVLQELQQPFVPPSDPSLWSEQLAHAKPARLFLQLLDYSKDSNGDPGPDPKDNILYVVTELAQYSLKDYLALRRDQVKPLQKDLVRNIARAIVLVVAGLHAKGFVHLDLKPENLMMFNGRLKLIDVDGCVKTGTAVSIQDSSISFSPCYCAPEWARFLIEDADSKISVVPALDVWSVGMTICELVTLDAILKPMYANFLRNGHSHREAGFLFMDWLSSVKKAPISKTVEKFDPEFTDLLVNYLLVFDPEKRQSLAKSFAQPYLAAAASGESRKSKTGESKQSISQDNSLTVDEQVKPSQRIRDEDNSSKKPMLQGTLYKLDTGGDPKDPIKWRKRDMWVTSNGSLCYYSIKEVKRLVLIDGAKLQGAKVTTFADGARDHAFMLETKSEEYETADKEPAMYFACESAEDFIKWKNLLSRAVYMDGFNMTMRLGANMKNDLDRFMLTVKNRRIVVGESNKADFEPSFKGKLWKLKAEGDRMKEEDWFEREMWIAKNGSLVYWSKKEERDLVYYTSDDIRKAKFKELDNNMSIRPWPFQIQLQASQDIEFTPGEFAALSEDMRTKWIEEFKSLQSSSP